LGCHVDGVDGHWSTTLSGSGFRFIAPSRFGYFGSTLPKGAAPADQADAYAVLLHRLGIDRTVVIGFSAGSASVLEFVARHRERVLGLILANARLGGGITSSRLLRPIFRFAYSAVPLWIFKKLAPAAYARMMGAPKGYLPTPAEARTLDGIRELLFPLKPRRDGAVFDGFVSNPVADRFPLEKLAVPTLVITALDDPLAPHSVAVEAAERIPAAWLVTIEGGGHLFLGHDVQVRDEITAFTEFVLSARPPTPTASRG
jgi:pimeloyl-ACP methyl ester carboxylesterase